MNIYTDKKTKSNRTFKSDLFATLFSEKTDNPSLELQVTVINLNHENNQVLLQHAKTLSDYTAFVRCVTEQLAQNIDRDEAITTAVKYCIANHILEEFLTSHNSEVAEMMKFQWTVDDVIEAEREDARQEGEEKHSRLCKMLLSRGRMEDLSKSLDDEAFRQQLYEEFHIV